MGWAAVPLGAGQNQVLRIASDATFPPFHYVEGSSAPTGFDIELARLVAERAGFQPVLLVRPYDDLLPGLTSGAHDLVAATTGVTPEREKVYLFTRPYFETCQAALVRVGPKEPSTIADLRGGGWGRQGPAPRPARSGDPGSGARSPRQGSGGSPFPRAARHRCAHRRRVRRGGHRPRFEGPIGVLAEPMALERSPSSFRLAGTS